MRRQAYAFLRLRCDQLWNLAGQTRYRALHGAILFPSGVNGASVGAIEVKAAWKVLDARELASARFYSVKALVSKRSTRVRARRVATGLRRIQRRTTIPPI
jgi:hypothetical protein